MKIINKSIKFYIKIDIDVGIIFNVEILKMFLNDL